MRDRVLIQSVYVKHLGGTRYEVDEDGVNGVMWGGRGYSYGVSRTGAFLSQQTALQDTLKDLLLIYNSRMQAIEQDHKHIAQIKTLMQ